MRSPLIAASGTVAAEQGVPVLGLAVAAVGLTVLTASGGGLEHALAENALIEAHAEQGELLEVAAGIFAGIVVVAAAVTGPWVSVRVPFLARVGATPGGWCSACRCSPWSPGCF